MIRVLLADDSAVTREYLTHLLDEDPELQVVGAAIDGAEAVAMVEQLRPDLVLMDIHMPRMSGYEATHRIMEETPTPVVIVTSSLSREETAIAFQALQAGALAAVEKPHGPCHPNQAAEARHLLETAKLMAEVKVVRRWPRRVPAGPAPAAAGAPPPTQRIRLVTIGASTGGPAVVAGILRELPPDLAVPILLVQHITAGFVNGLAEWLDQGSRLAVKVAEDAEAVRPGSVYVAPDGVQLGITREGEIRLEKGAPEGGFSPSATYLFRSAAQAYGRAALGIVLTGMGQDGAAGLRCLREAGGITIAQDEESSVVFGMPGEAIRIGAVAHVLSPKEITETIRALGAG